MLFFQDLPQLPEIVLHVFDSEQRGVVLGGPFAPKS
jgi:hypothetical protein